MRALAKKPKDAQQAPSAKSPKISQSSVRHEYAINAPLLPRRALQSPPVNIDSRSVNSNAAAVPPYFSPIPLNSRTDKSLQPTLKSDSAEGRDEQEPGNVAVQLLPREGPEDETEKAVQCKACSHPSLNPSSTFNTSIASLQRGGQPLPQAEQAFFEPRFGRDFSRVRVHADREAAESARAVNARAFTLGGDIVFGAGEYPPRAAGGRKLLAHELAHVVQQGNEANSKGSPPAMIQRDDVTQMSLTPQYARGLSDEELSAQIQIITGQTLEFEFLGTATSGGEREVAQCNLSLLQEEQRRRQRQRELERRGRNWAVTAMSLTPAHAEVLSDEDLREQMRILADQIEVLEFLGPPAVEGEEEIARSNLSLLQEERRRRNQAVTRTSITPPYAESLPDEDLQEQMQILSDQIAEMEYFGIPGIGEGEEETARANFAILSLEQRRRRREERGRRIHGADWGGFSESRDIDAVVSLEDRILYVMETLVQRYHYPVDGAAALVGNFMVESGGTMAPNILQGGSLAQRGEPAPQRGGVGLAQWTGARREEVLETEQGVDILFDMDAQLDYMVSELQGSYAGVDNVLNHPPNIDEATRSVYEVYEAPQPVVDAARARSGGNAEEIERTTTEMNRVGQRRRTEAHRARELYRREYPEE